jgi:hypothetical protein
MPVATCTRIAPRVSFRCSSRNLRVFRGISTCNLPGYVGFLQFLRNFRQQNACEQAELILWAALDPPIADKAKKGELVTCLDHLISYKLL